MNKIIPILLTAALTAVLADVFIVDSFLWQGAITGKYFWFAAAMCIAVPLILSATFFSLRREKRVLRRADIWIFLLATYWVVNYCLLNGWPNMHWWLFLLTIPLYAVVRAACEDEITKRLLSAAFLLVILTEAVWGLLQLYGFTHSHHGLYKITGTLFNPGPYSGFVAAGVPLALGYALNKKARDTERWLGGITLIAALLILPAAMSRAAWLAALTGSIPVLWKYIPIGNRWKEYLQRRSVRIFAGIALSVIIIGGSAGMYFLKKDSADGRRLIWQVSANIVKKHPLFGAGFGTFPVAYGNAQADYFLKGKGTDEQTLVADCPDSAFNEYIQTAVETGLIGLALLVATLAACFGFRRAESEKNGRSPAADIRYSLLSLSIFALFSYPFGVLPLAVLFVFMAAMSASSSPRLSLALPGWLQVMGIFLCLGITAYGAYNILSRYSAYRLWSSSQVFYQTEAYNEAVKNYRTLYAALKHERQFLFEYGQSLSKTEQYEESNRIFGEFLHYGCDPMIFNCMGNNFKAMKKYTEAEAAYMKASQIVPNRHYPLYLLMKLYVETDQTERAEAMAETLLAKPVKVPSTAIREMRDEAKKIIGKTEDKEIKN